MQKKSIIHSLLILSCLVSLTLACDVQDKKVKPVVKTPVTKDADKDKEAKVPETKPPVTTVADCRLAQQTWNVGMESDTSAKIEFAYNEDRVNEAHDSLSMFKNKDTKPSLLLTAQGKTEGLIGKWLATEVEVAGKPDAIGFADFIKDDMKNRATSDKSYEQNKAQLTYLKFETSKLQVTASAPTEQGKPIPVVIEITMKDTAKNKIYLCKLETLATPKNQEASEIELAKVDKGTMEEVAATQPPAATAPTTPAGTATTP